MDFSNRKYYLFFLILFKLLLCYSAEKPTPVVMWHGMGDSCCFPFSLGAVKKLIEAHVEGVYVKSLKIGGCIVEDYKSGFFLHPNKQIEDVCNQIANDRNLSNGYSAIGFSQGGQFLRAVAQRCPNPPMKTLISLGGQHQGIFGLPYCPSLSRKTCEYIRKVLNYAAYENWVQKGLVQATYWHDPLNEEEYKKGSTFLAEINNELNKNQSYIDNLLKLKRLILVKFLNDTIVQPKESQWFEFYRPGQDKEILPLHKSEIYTEDKLGLKVLKESGKLLFLGVEGDHLRFSEEWFVKTIIPFFRE